MGRDGRCFTDLQEFLYRIDVARAKARIPSTRALAREAGLSETSIHNLWKTGRKRFPDADDAVRIARALETTVEYLVTGEHAPHEQLRPALQEICDMLEGLNDTELAEIRGIVRNYLITYQPEKREREAT